MKYHPILRLNHEHRLTAPLPRRARPAARSRRTAAPVGSTAIHDFVEQLADNVSAHGISPFEPEVSRLVRIARHHGVVSNSVDIVADRGEPRAARERALGRVISALVTLGDLRAAAAA